MSSGSKDRPPTLGASKDPRAESRSSCTEGGACTEGGGPLACSRSQGYPVGSLGSYSAASQEGHSPSAKSVMLGCSLIGVQHSPLGIRKVRIVHHPAGTGVSATTPSELGYPLLPADTNAGLPKATSEHSLKNAITSCKESSDSLADITISQHVYQRRLCNRLRLVAC